MSAQVLVEHVAAHEHRGQFPNLEHRFVCSCGEAGPWVRVAGMVHGGEAAHLEQVAPIVDPLSMPDVLRRDAVEQQKHVAQLAAIGREERERGHVAFRSMVRDWQVEEAELYAGARLAADAYREALGPP